MIKVTNEMKAYWEFNQIQKERPLCLHVFYHWWWTVCIAAKMSSTMCSETVLWLLDPAVGYWLSLMFLSREGVGLQIMTRDTWILHVGPSTLKIHGIIPSWYIVLYIYIYMCIYTCTYIYIYLNCRLVLTALWGFQQVLNLDLICSPVLTVMPSLGLFVFKAISFAAVWTCFDTHLLCIW